MLRLGKAIVPVLVSSFMLRFHLRWRMNDMTMNLSWPIAIPILIGSAAILFWLRAQWTNHPRLSARGTGVVPIEVAHHQQGRVLKRLAIESVF